MHCDLKPENVLIMGNGWANLTDLGLTRALAGSAATAEAIASVAATSQQLGQPGLTISQISTMILSAPSTDDREVRVARMRDALIAAGALPTAVANISDQAHYSQRIPPLPTVSAIGSRGPVAGTPAYMAPEQWWGMDAVTPATDVYAFGVLLFELFSGAPHLLPHDEPSAYLSHEEYFAAWYTAHRNGPVRSLRSPEAWALTAGPLSVLMEEQSDRGTQLAEQVLDQLDRLIGVCLAPQAALRPTAAAVQQMLAKLAQELGEAPQKVPEIWPHTLANEGIFWGNLAITYGNLGQKEERLRLLRRAVSLDEANPTKWANLGGALYELGRYEEALAAYAEAERRLTPEQVANHDPLVIGLRSNQGSTLAQLKRYEEAIAAYQRCLALQPDRANAYNNLAIIYGQWVEADLAELAKRPAGVSTPSVTAATLAQWSERLHLGQEAAQRALALAPGFAQARQLLQLLAATQEHIERLAPGSSSGTSGT